MDARVVPVRNGLVVADEADVALAFRSSDFLWQFETLNHAYDLSFYNVLFYLRVLRFHYVIHIVFLYFDATVHFYHSWWLVISYFG